MHIQKSRNIQLPIVRPIPPPTTRQNRRPQTTRKKKKLQEHDLHTCTHKHVLSMLINSKNYKTDNTLHTRYLENVFVCVCVCVCVCARARARAYVCVCENDIEDRIHSVQYER